MGQRLALCYRDKPRSAWPTRGWERLRERPQHSLPRERHLAGTLLSFLMPECERIHFCCLKLRGL